MTTANDAFVVLCLHCDGADAATSFPDVSQAGKTVTAVGNAQIDTAQSAFGSASALFDGTGDYLQVTQVGGDLAPGTGNFTVEMRVRLAATQTNKSLIGNRRDAGGLATQFYLGFQATNNCLSVHTGAAAKVDNTTDPLSNDTWHLVTLSRESGVGYLGLDGTIIETFAFTEDLSSTEHWFIGGNDVFLSGGGSLNGWQDEIRISNGIARYTANFTPPTEAYPSEADGAAAGVASTSGVGASTAGAEATASGSAAVAGVGDSALVISADGSAEGLASVSGVGTPVHVGVGSSAGLALVEGISFFFRPDSVIRLGGVREQIIDLAGVDQRIVRLSGRSVPVVEITSAIR